VIAAVAFMMGAYGSHIRGVNARFARGECNANGFKKIFGGRLQAFQMCQHLETTLLHNLSFSFQGGGLVAG